MGSKTRAGGPAAPTLATIRLALIDPPDAPLRSQVDGVALEELAASIRRYGLIEPMVVEPVTGGRFRVIAGHRRWRACQLAELLEAPCVVRTDTEARDAVQLAENLEREELSAFDQAAKVGRMYEQLGDVDQVAARLGRTRAYVDKNLELLAAPDLVLVALRDGKIGIGQALELARLPTEDLVRHYLQFVVSSGATVRQVRDWVNQAKARSESDAASAAARADGAPGAPSPEAAPAPGPSFLSIARPYELSGGLDARQCRLCGDTRIESQMWRWFVCQPCGDEYTRRAAAEGKIR